MRKNEIFLKKIIVGTGNKGKLKEFSDMLATEGIEVVGKKEIENFLEPEEKETDFIAQSEAKALYYAGNYGAYVEKGTGFLSDDSGVSVDFGVDLSDENILISLWENDIDLQNYELPNGEIVDFTNFDIGDGCVLNLLAMKDFPGLATGRIAKLFSCEEDKDGHEGACNLYKRIYEVVSDNPNKPISVRFVSSISIAVYDKEAEQARIIGSYRVDEYGHLISPGIKGENGFGYDPNFMPINNNPNALTYAQMTQDEKNLTSPRRAALSKFLKDKFQVDTVLRNDMQLTKSF